MRIKPDHWFCDGS